jgi:hypothetical protein
MKKIRIGLIVGVIAGIFDVIPMIVQGLSWDANFSAFTMWVIVGVLTATTDIKLKSALKGILIAFLILLPTAILIGWKEPLSLIPIGLMTIILGSITGFLIDKWINRKT